MPAKKRQPSSARRWSQHVTETSNALDLDSGVFAWSDPKRIAASLKHSAEASHRRKGSPLQSAMSMLNFYINRAGENLTAKQEPDLGASQGGTAETIRQGSGSDQGARFLASGNGRKYFESFHPGKPSVFAQLRWGLLLCSLFPEL
jgi:hypothetical protein